jgi:hypothetical protein
MQFYILMVDYGRGPQQPMGLEAVVQLELTRQNIIDQARDILRRGEHEVAFVKFIDGNYCEDVTLDILCEARDLMELA